VSVVPISIGRTIDVPQASRMLAECRLGSFFSHLGLWGRAVLAGAEGERGGASIGSRISVLTSFTSNIANLLTSSNQSALFTSRAKQNPPLGRSQLPLLLLHLSRPSNLRSILPVALWLTFGRLDGEDSPLRDGWALCIDNIPQRCRARLSDDVHVHRYPSGWYRQSGSRGNRGQSGLRQAEY